MRADGTFIAIDVDDALAADPEIARRLSEACPVDIYAQDADGKLRLVESNIDECVLCRLCIDAVGGDTDALKVIKLYDGGAVLA